MDAERTSLKGWRRYGSRRTLMDLFEADIATIVGELTQSAAFSVDQTQIAAWQGSIECLREVLGPFRSEGHLFLEFDVPRLGRRIDAVLVLRHAVFVIEFKVGAKAFLAADLDQVVDYALDLKNFHETS